MGDHPKESRPCPQVSGLLLASFVCPLCFIFSWLWLAYSSFSSLLSSHSLPCLVYQSTIFLVMLPNKPPHFLLAYRNKHVFTTYLSVIIWSLADLSWVQLREGLSLLYTYLMAGPEVFWDMFSWQKARAQRANLIVQAYFKPLLTLCPLI